MPVPTTIFYIISRSKRSASYRIGCFRGTKEEMVLHFQKKHNYMCPVVHFYIDRLTRSLARKIQSLVLAEFDTDRVVSKRDGRQKRLLRAPLGKILLYAWKVLQDYAKDPYRNYEHLQ